MRLYDLEIFQSDFRFHLVDTAGRPFFVFYNDDNLTVRCSCPSRNPCEHTAYIHEVLIQEKEETTLSFLRDSREANSQAVTKKTVDRMRGAFAREYNLAKGIVQYPDPSPRGPRPPLGWEGNVPGWREKVRVVEIPNQPNVFAVYKANSDKYSTIERTPIPKCNHKDCQDPEREVFCKHEAALREAVFTWQNAGLLPKAKPPEIKRESTTGNKPITLTYDDLKMVEKAEPVSRTGKAEGGWITVPPGFDGTYKINLTGLDALAKIARDRIEEASRRNLESVIWNTTSATTAVDADAEFDFKKFEEGVNKAKKLLEKKEEPKPEKPPKLRTRFTDLEL